MGHKPDPPQEQTQKKYFNDPYQSVRERFMDKNPPERVSKLLQRLDNITGEEQRYGNYGERVIVRANRGESGRSPVGRVDHVETTETTICAKCEHCVPDMMKSAGKDQLAYAKCAKTAEHLPDKVNVITGERISKQPEMDYCSNKNHGECPDFSAKKLSRGRAIGSPRAENIRSMLDKIKDGDDEQIAWEDYRQERNNPWETTFKRFVKFVKDHIPVVKFE